MHISIGTLIIAPQSCFHIHGATHFVTEDIDPVQEEKTPEGIDSIIFTKKAKKEGKEAYIIEALQKSVQGRKDKTRAFVHELHAWQKEGYIDAHYNARVMYDELDKLMPIPFGYDSFKRLYNDLDI